MKPTSEISTNDQKSIFSWIKEWRYILPEISDWLKLLALVVLAAILFIIIVMILTPKDNPNFALYPYIVIILFFIIVIGTFIDRSNERKIKVEDTLVRTIDNKLEIEQKVVKRKEDQNFTDSNLGFKIYCSKKENWQQPLFLSYKDYFLKTGFATSGDIDELMDMVLVHNPYGKMYIEAKMVVFQYENDITIEFVNGSTNQDIEDYLKRLQIYSKEEENIELTDEQLQELRKEAFLGSSQLLKANFFISLSLQVLEKKFAINSKSKPNLYNVLKTTISSTQESIEQLSIAENSAIWVTRDKLLNVKVNGESEGFTVYRTYKLIESKEKIYLLQMQWSPNSNSAIEVWDELSKMLDSFEVVN